MADAAIDPTRLAAVAAVWHRHLCRGEVRILDTSSAGQYVVRAADLTVDPSFDQLVRSLSQVASTGDAAGADIIFQHGQTVPQGWSGASCPVVVPLPNVGTVALRELIAVSPESFGAQVATMLASGLAHGWQPVSAHDLASPADRELVLELGGTGVPVRESRCIHDLVDTWVRKTPEAIAVFSANETLSYRLLSARADALARRLVASGVGPEDVVGVLAGRSPRLIIAMLAVLKAGAAYLALDPASPWERSARELRDAAVRVVVADVQTDELAAAPVTVVTITADWHDPLPSLPLPRPVPANIAYLSYTSGSTGRPKAVAVPHAAVSRLVQAPSWADFGPADRFIQAAPPAFDASVLEIWGALCSGAQLLVPPPGRLEAESLAKMVAEAGVTVLWLTAGLFQVVVEQYVDRFAGVRHLVTGGDVVSPAAAARLLAAHQGIRLTNGYGPTENTTFTTCAEVGATTPGEPVPIGKPIDGTRVAVLDAQLRVVPPGVIGELYAAGAGLARGYFGRPAETAERFIPAPGGQRMYRTGDLARWRSDGSLDFLGRVDRQVKVSGYRVEPAEVEALLVHYPGVEAAVVVPVRGRDDALRLVAYVLPEAGAQRRDFPSYRLKTWLRARLPAYLVPAWVGTLPELPLTANGKIDRSALPALTCLPRSLPHEMTPPRDETQRRMCELWADVLGVDQVGIKDDFFEMGGHSLIAADLLAAIGAEFGVDISAKSLYLSPTVVELTEFEAFDGTRLTPVTGDPVLAARDGVA